MTMRLGSQHLVTGILRLFIQVREIRQFYTYVKAAHIMLCVKAAYGILSTLDILFLTFNNIIAVCFLFKVVMTANLRAGI